MKSSLHIKLIMWGWPTSKNNVHFLLLLKPLLVICFFPESVPKNIQAVYLPEYSTSLSSIVSQDVSQSNPCHDLSAASSRTKVLTCCVLLQANIKSQFISWRPRGGQAAQILKDTESVAVTQHLLSIPSLILSTYTP